MVLLLDLADQVNGVGAAFKRGRTNAAGKEPHTHKAGAEVAALGRPVLPVRRRRGKSGATRLGIAAVEVVGRIVNPAIAIGIDVRIGMEQLNRDKADNPVRDVVAGALGLIEDWHKPHRTGARAILNLIGEGVAQRTGIDRY